MNPESIKYQIAAIQKAMDSGKAKNKWAALNKIKCLKKQLLEVEKATGWKQYLAQ